MKRIARVAGAPFRAVLIGAVSAYRLLFAGMLAGRCRFHPSCSAYALEAVERHGVLRGGYLAVRRLLRCHPWNPGGVDLVPEKGDRSWWSRGRRPSVTVETADTPDAPSVALGHRPQGA